MTTIAGLFNNLSEARCVVETLLDKGVSDENISLIASDTHGEYVFYQTDEEAGLSRDEAVIQGVSGQGILTDDRASAQRGNTVFKAATRGGEVGGTLGVLLGVTALVVPGVGPVVLAGPAGHVVFGLLSTVTGTGVGTLLGAFTGALKDEQIAEREAHTYVEWLQRGGALVLVKTDDVHEGEVSNLLMSAGAVHTHTAEWHQYEGEDLVTPVDRNIPEWRETSKVGTTAGAAAGAATGAMVGSLVGPAGTISGGAVGSAAGATVGALGDVGGKQLEEQQQGDSKLDELSDEE